MSTPSRPLVTIDDPVTIIEPHRVLLEWVEAVHRDHFQTRQQSADGRVDALHRHNDEGTTWARGHHLPHSEVVVALRTAVSLIEGIGAREALPTPRRHVMKPAPPTSPATWIEMMKEMERQTREHEKTTKQSWWRLWFDPHHG